MLMEGFSRPAHVVNIGSQELIGTYSKALHYTPHSPQAHEPDTTKQDNHDEIGLVCAICVKVCSHSLQRVYHRIFLKEHLSAKQKELYKQVQTKAAVVSPTQLLLDMKVWWSSTYVMINRAESNKEASQNLCIQITVS
jgi:hypothetical protein